MNFSIKIKPETLKLFLILTIIVILGIITAIFIGYRYFSEHPEKLLSVMPDGADISINKVYQESLRNGIKEWSLNASSANYFEEQKKVKFKNFEVTFFLDNREKIILKADRGILNTGSNDIEVEGNVTVTHKSYYLLTDKMFYDNKKRIIFSKTRVNITGKSFKLEANSMLHDLKTDKAAFNRIVLDRTEERAIVKGKSKNRVEAVFYPEGKGIK